MALGGACDPSARCEGSTLARARRVRERPTKETRGTGAEGRSGPPGTGLRPNFRRGAEVGNLGKWGKPGSAKPRWGKRASGGKTPLSREERAEANTF